MMETKNKVSHSLPSACHQRAQPSQSLSLKWKGEGNLKEREQETPAPAQLLRSWPSWSTPQAVPRPPCCLSSATAPIMTCDTDLFDYLTSKGLLAGLKLSEIRIHAC
ncbi:uncharacterized protein WM277_025204 isoform 1-T2 [Molossus nigricans]